MADQVDKFAGKWSELEEQVARLRPATSVGADVIGRWRSDAKAMLFHLKGRGKKERPALAVLLGGTGTGKSTITNRLLDGNISAASFRRTFTSGPVAVARNENAVPDE